MASNVDKGRLAGGGGSDGSGDCLERVSEGSVLRRAGEVAIDVENGYVNLKVI